MSKNKLYVSWSVEPDEVLVLIDKLKSYLKDS
jgi:hypothetical protein